MPKPTGRDLSALLEHGWCVICHEPAPQKHVVPWVQAHATRHLASGEAIVQISTPRKGGYRTERVVPTSSLPDEQPRVTLPAHLRAKRAPQVPRGFKRWSP